ncbi:hypothetical protein LMCDFJHI_01238 [Aeromonas salmonicida]
MRAHETDKKRAALGSPLFTSTLGVFAMRPPNKQPLFALGIGGHVLMAARLSHVATVLNGTSSDSEISA